MNDKELGKLGESLDVAIDHNQMISSRSAQNQILMQTMNMMPI